MLPEPPRPDLIAAMIFDPLAGIVDLEAHLTDLADRATAHDYRFDRHAVRNELQAATFRLRSAASIRLFVSPTGMMAIETIPIA